MEPQRTTHPRRAARLPVGGFTLTELLVVVGILGLLMAMLTPSLMHAVYAARRIAVCSSNQSTIAKAAQQYALSGRKKKLPTVFWDERRFKSHKVWNNFGQEWWNLYDPDESGPARAGNPACLWLLVSEGHCPRKAFVCPQAKADRAWDEPSLEDKHFRVETDGSETTSCTLSFSYISMVARDWRERNIEEEDIYVHRKMTLDTVPNTLVVVADQNPRCEPGLNVLRTKSELQRGLSKEKDKRLALNSPNHLQKGQNMARLDGSVVWSDEPNSPSYEDEIYFADENLPTADERLGRRLHMRDAFLLP